MNKEISLKNAKCSALTLEAPVQFLKKENDGVTLGDNFLIEAYTGATVERWWGKLAIEVAGIKANKNIPVFRDHNSASIVGHSHNTFKDGSFFVEGTFSQVTETAKEVKGLADEAFPWQASIGVKPIKVMSLQEGGEMTVNGQAVQGPAEVWLESEVFETSFVPFGADGNTTIARFSKFIEADPPGGGEALEHNTHEEEHDMPITLEQLKTDAPDLLATIQTDAKASGYDEGLQAGVADERARVAAIMAIDNADELARKQAIDEGLSEEAAYKLFFLAERNKRQEGLAEFQNGTPASVGQSGTSTQSDDSETFMDAVTAYKKEKGCTRTEAMKAVVSARPALHAKWLDSIGQGGKK